MCMFVRAGVCVVCQLCYCGILSECKNLIIRNAFARAFREYDTLPSFLIIDSWLKPKVEITGDGRSVHEPNSKLIN